MPRGIALNVLNNKSSNTMTCFGSFKFGLVFDAEQYARWENVTKKFTLNSANFSEYAKMLAIEPCTSPPVESFTKSAVEGNHIWLDPPHNKIFHMLSHYKDCKAKSPHNTSACIVVPRWSGGSSWRKLLQGMRLLHEYPSGTPLYFKHQAEGAPAPVPAEPYPIQIWYDPPVTIPMPRDLPGVEMTAWTIQDDGPRGRHKKSLGVIRDFSETEMKFSAVVNGVATTVYLDSCSVGANWITIEFAAKCGIQLRHTDPKTVELPGNKIADMARVCAPRLQMGVHGSTHVCYEIETLPGGVGMLLGTPWQSHFAVDL